MLGPLLPMVNLITLTLYIIVDLMENMSRNTTCLTDSWIIMSTVSFLLCRTHSYHSLSTLY